MEYTRENLDFAIKQVCPEFRDPRVWKCLNRPTALRMAVVEAFVEWESWHNACEVIDVLRAAEKDLKVHGQFNFLDSE